jgi:hypothetical protein
VADTDSRAGSDGSKGQGEGNNDKLVHFDDDGKMMPSSCKVDGQLLFILNKFGLAFTLQMIQSE